MLPNRSRCKPLLGAFLAAFTAAATAPAALAANNDALLELLRVLKEKGTIDQATYDQLKGVAQVESEQTTKEQEDMKKSTKEVAEKVSKDESKHSWVDKVKVSTLLYADYANYYETGFGPQFLTQINPPGPGNDGFNSFDITRTYLNVLFTPNDDWTFRLTPNIYRAIGSSTADKSGKTGAIGSNLDGNLNFRLKYAYVQYNKLLDGIEPLKGGMITVGQQMNPLVDWEEALYGFRYVNLVPWNYLSLSSTQVGVSLKGPIKFNGRTYVDYDFGVYNNAAFRTFEQTDEKQGMVRVSVYPFGAEKRFDGLGLTGFYDRGHGNVTPDTTITTALKGPDSDIERVAALVHYTTNDWQLAGEYDWGKNAFTPGNLFSGSGPGDVFGVATGFADFTTMTNNILNTGKSEQEGYDVFGHYHIPGTPLTLFGMYEKFMPNTRVDHNPLDFERFVGGINWDYSKFLRLALASQNLWYSHDQFDFPITPGISTKVVKNAVPEGIHAMFVNLEFSY